MSGSKSIPEVKENKVASNNRAQRLNAGGFTFIEVLLVVAVLGLLTGMSAPRLSDRLADYRLYVAANTLATELRRTRADAIVEAKVYEVRVFNEYYVVRELRHPMAVTVRSYYWPAGIRLDPNWGKNGTKFTYGALGFVNPLDNNTIVLRDSRGKTRKVIVSSGGRVRIE